MRYPIAPRALGSYVQYSQGPSAASQSDWPSWAGMGVGDGWLIGGRRLEKLGVGASSLTLVFTACYKSAKGFYLRVVPVLVRPLGSGALWP
jgi:hypothetical protein